MRKMFKKVAALVLAATLSMGTVDFPGRRVEYEKSVKASVIELGDSTEITGDIIPDSELLTALKNIINGGNSITVGQLRTYTKAIDLSGYKKIQDITGLGMAQWTPSINLSGTSVKEIPQREFEDCTLTQITFPEGLETIGRKAFEYTAITSVVIPSSVTLIDEAAFAHNTALKYVEIKDFPDGLTEGMVKVIGGQAFSGDSGIEELIFPTGHEYDPLCTMQFGFRAFGGCSGLSGTIVIPANVTSIGDDCFVSCCSVSVDWNAEKQGSTMVKRFIKSYDVISLNAVAGKEKQTVFAEGDSRFHVPCDVYISSSDLNAIETDEAKIPIYIKSRDNVKEADLKANEYKMYRQYVKGPEVFDLSKCTRATFGKCVFLDNVSLKKVILPDTLTVITKEMFRASGVEIIAGNGQKARTLPITDLNEKLYIGLETVEMSDNVVTIGEAAFQNTYNLNIKMPEKLEVIKDNAFENVKGIHSLKFGSALKGIGSYAFSGTGLKQSNVMIDGIGLCDVDLSGACNLSHINPSAFYQSAVHEVKLHKDAPVQSIQTATFSDCQFLSSIILNDNMKCIQTKAFVNTIRLKTLSIPDVCSIHPSAFEGSFTSSIKIEDVEPLDLSTTGIYTYGAAVPDIEIRVINENIFVSKNKSVILPNAATYYTTNEEHTIKSVEVGTKLYNYDSELKQLVGDINNNLVPTVEKKSFSYPSRNAINNVYENIKYDSMVVNIFGNADTQTVDVKVVSILNFKVSSTNSVEKTVTTLYKVKSKYNKCTDIKFTEYKEGQPVEFKIPVTSTTAITINPTFIMEYDELEMSDTPEWSMVTSNGLIEMNVSDNNMTATVKRTTDASYGNEIIKIKVGNVEKNIPITISAPSNSVAFDSTRKGVYVGNVVEYIATIKYASTYAEAALEYPDSMIFTSSDESIATIEGVQKIDDATYIVRARGVQKGKVSIKATTVGSKKSATATLDVAATDTQVELKDAEGNGIASNSLINVKGTAETALYYSFTDSFTGDELVYECSEEGAVTVTFNTTTKKVSIKGKKKGTFKVYIYPAFGTKEDGVEIDVNVYASVYKSSGIVLQKKYIKKGTVENVFVSMKNEFYSAATADINMITEASEENFKNVTDNRIEFTSSDTSIATVDDYGNVTGVKIPANGAAVTITCKAYDGDTVKSTASAYVYVVTSVLESVSYTGDASINVGETKTFNISYLPEDCEIKQVTVSQSNSTTTSYEIDQTDGIKVNVTGLKAGTNTIKVTLKSMKNTSNVEVSKTVSIPVTVMAVYPDPIEVTGATILQQKDLAVKFTWIQTDEQVAIGQSYKVYIDNKLYKTYTTAQNVDYTFKTEGTHTIRITAVSGTKETTGVTLNLTLKIETTQTPTTTQQTTTQVQTTQPRTTQAQTTQVQTTQPRTTQAQTTQVQTTKQETTTVSQPDPIEVKGAAIISQNNLTVTFGWTQTAEQLEIGQSYKVYIDGTFYMTYSEAQNVEYTFAEEGAHTIKIVAVLGRKQTSGVTLNVTLENETTTQQTTTQQTTTQQTTTQQTTTQQTTTQQTTTQQTTTQQATTQQTTTQPQTTKQETGTESQPDPIEVKGASIVSVRGLTVRFIWTQSLDQIELGQSYKVYIDDSFYRTYSEAQAVEYTFRTEGEHTIKIIAVLGRKQTEGVTLEISLTNETTTTEESTTQRNTQPYTIFPETTQEVTTVETTTVEETSTEEPTTEEKTTEEKTTSEPKTTVEIKTTEEATTYGLETTREIKTTGDNGNKTTTAYRGSTTQNPTKKITVKKTKIKSAKRLKNKKKAKIVYKKVTGVTGYEIAVSTSKKFKKKGTVVYKVRSTKTKFVVKKLKKTKKYYVKIRAFVGSGANKSYAKWSKVKTIKK